MKGVLVMVGTVRHYYNKIGVAAVELYGLLINGKHIWIHGKKTSFGQLVSSIELNHEKVNGGNNGQVVGIKVKKRVRKGDKVYLVTEMGSIEPIHVTGDLPHSDIKLRKVQKAIQGTPGTYEECLALLKRLRDVSNIRVVEDVDDTHFIPTDMVLLSNGKIIDKQPIKITVSIKKGNIKALITGIFATPTAIVDGFCVLNQAGSVLAKRLYKESWAPDSSKPELEIAWVLESKGEPVTKVYERS